MDIIHSRNTLSPIHAGVIVSSQRITVKRNIIHFTPIPLHPGAIARSPLLHASFNLKSQI
ncbi:MAG: hypothetical protein JGK17_16175 [Microcoleus sp. PH2017_10_PVI_O_A]|uniref:hypothetical protein n=1 Tax=unclassified Microcoleus TaxID=2642155 RepID=UPI001DFF36F1|nr:MULTISPECIES: hypothetical protein [unclassified Microcoleus]MCC3407097.1 hypothetical protein [Microcoleus sp. PH2017_10_PVI_O_A]MCC3461107.1 hypothetical protein [Microcoleus sp. PH2017_11_PCY_U_A]MCC3479624.1 hypothetical protein [Microcoleus sp. PH2017_12_PCY_D_A]MCC3529729.1 hypothetical protein [Microcoleus sp. PH2017_21_RUC_O_A]MCC3541988.1 hypothetical protein [Microcoleus sp. PH2017_22_RUC_O_B]